MKDKIISIRLSEAEYRRAVTLAAAANKKVSEVYREAVNHADVKFNDAKDFAGLIAALNHIGNNINQIARVLNTANKKGELDAVDYDDLKNSLLIIAEGIKELVR
jgi:predicted transcriptional regulator